MRDIKIAHRYTEHKRTLNLFLAEATKYQPLTPAQEAKATKDELIKHNMLFVVSIAKYYHIKNVDIMDLISEGMIGLHNAAERFDKTKGFKFISYAVIWIRQRMFDYLQLQIDSVYLPRKHKEAFVKINKIKDKDDSITDEELAEIIGANGAFYVSSYNKGHSVESMDINYDVDDDYQKQYPSSENAEVLTHSYDHKRIINHIYRFLDERERYILQKLFIEDMTYNSIGKDLGLTHERIRQIKKEAIRKIRSRSGELTL